VTPDSFSPTTLTTEGPQTITVSYQGKTDTYTVTVSAAPANLKIAKYETIAVTRVGLTDYDYTIRAYAINNGYSSAKNVTALLTGMPSNLTPQGDVTFSFGDIAAGAMEKSGNTITIRLDRSVVFDESLLLFTFSYAE